MEYTTNLNLYKPVAATDAHADLVTANRTNADTIDANLRKNNFAGTVAPTVNDDSGDGYHVGSKWLVTVEGKEYTCLDATVGAAVWAETGGAGGGTGGKLYLYQNYGGW